MKSLLTQLLTVVAITFSFSILIAQSPPAPFTDACNTGDLYQVVAGDLFIYNFNDECIFEEQLVCDSYMDENGDVINLTNYNSLGFNEADNLLYALTRDEELVVIGSNCVAEIKGMPTIDVPTGSTCESTMTFPSTFSATFDDEGNVYILDNGKDILYTLDVNTNTATNCIMISVEGQNRVTSLNDIAWDAPNDRLIGIRGSILYSIDPLTGITTTEEILGLNNEGNSAVGSIFGISNGTIIAFYNDSGNYYQVDPATGVATYVATTASNSTNDGTSCSQVNIFCPNELEVTATASCVDGNGNPANEGEYYVELITNYDPNDPSVTTATPDFTVIADGTVETTTYDGVSILVIGPYTAESVILEIKETDDGDLSTKDYCVDVIEIVQVDEIPCSNVPVELLSFKGENKGKVTELIWETASEINSSHFDVERSEDGKNFSKIGSLSAKGISWSMQQYLFHDQNIMFDRTYYYRLKQIDIDQNFEYSFIIIVKTELPYSFNVYPSSAYHTLTIKGSTIIEKVTILDINGKLIDTPPPSYLKQQDLDVTALNPGLYFIEIVTNNRRQLRRFIKN